MGHFFGGESAFVQLIVFKHRSSLLRRNIEGHLMQLCNLAEREESETEHMDQATLDYCSVERCKIDIRSDETEGALGQAWKEIEEMESYLRDADRQASTLGKHEDK